MRRWSHTGRPSFDGFRATAMPADATLALPTALRAPATTAVSADRRLNGGADAFMVFLLRFAPARAGRRRRAAGQGEPVLRAADSIGGAGLRRG